MLNIFSPYGVLRGFSKSVAAVLLTPVLAIAEPVTILALGDSLTQGYGLVAQQGFVPQMQRWLEDQGQEVALINGGVSGDTTRGGLARIGWSLTPEVDGLIIALGSNDLLRGIDPDLSRRNLAGILDVAGASAIPVLLVGIHVPNNYGAEYKQVFESIYPDLAAQYDTLLADNFLAGLYDNPNDGLASVVRFLQSDGLHPNAAGVTRIVDALGPMVEELISLSKQKRASSWTPAEKP